MSDQKYSPTMTEDEKHTMAWEKTVIDTFFLAGIVSVIAAGIWGLNLLYEELNIGEILRFYGPLILSVACFIMIAALVSWAFVSFLKDRKGKNFKKLFGYDDPRNPDSVNNEQRGANGA